MEEMDEERSRRSSAEEPHADGPAPPAVKICGLRRPEDVEAAVRAGASFLGLVFADGSPRRISPADAAGLGSDVDARRVGVFVDAPPPEVLRTAQVASLDVVQLHGSESPELCEVFRGTGLEVWKALRPRSDSELAGEAERYAPSVDGLLVEGHSEEAAGGTGAEFPHEWVRRAGLGRRGEGGAPSLILAGGLTPENVGEAVRRVRPHVVDVSSGVEREPGVKEPDRIRRFVEASLGL